MDKYRKAFLAAAILISILCFFVLIIGLNNFNLTGFSLVIGYMILWWGMYFFLRTGDKLAFWFSFLLVNVFWWPLLFQSVRRIVFVVEHGGMDSADSYGSPLAFLIHLVFEQMIFLPLTIVFIFGLLAAIGFIRARRLANK